MSVDRVDGTMLSLLLRFSFASSLCICAFMIMMTGLPKAFGCDDGIAKLLSVMFLGADENKVCLLFFGVCLYEARMYYVTTLLALGRKSKSKS